MAVTASRRSHADRILALLHRHRKPLSAYQILEDLRSDGARASTTVYRALDKLIEAGHVHRIESLNAWIACRDPGHIGARAFEICESCGAVTEHIDTRLTESIVALGKNSGFKPRHVVVEIRGCCSACIRDAAHQQPNQYQ